MNGFPWLSLMTLIPLLGGVVIWLAREVALARMIAMAAALLELLLALGIWIGFPADGALHFVERRSWAPQIGLEYFLGLDGIGLCFLLVTAFVFPMALLSSRGQPFESRGYYAFLLLLEAGLVGTFTALNFLHWFFFWELSLLPAFFLLRMAGGPNRVQAATQFFLYTMVGSIAMLVGFLGLHGLTGTFDFVELGKLARTGALETALNRSNWAGWGGVATGTVIFWLLFLGFAVKLPLVPLHGWLPSTYTQAAIPLVMVFTGVMSKMGAYGLVRILVPILPQQIVAAQPVLLGLAVVTIVYGAFAALGQRDLKAMLAYSSLSHLGYCALGAFALAPGQTAALNGVLLQVFSHGVVAAALFAWIGFLQRRIHDGRCSLETFGGIRAAAPGMAGLVGILIFSSLGLPGLSGFPAEFLVFKGAFAVSPLAAVLALPGLLVTAIFLLRLLGAIFNGPLSSNVAGLADLTALEWLCLAPAVGLTLALGFAPGLLNRLADPALHNLILR